MNESQRLRLERDFDGELPAAERDDLRRELAHDPDASRHLDQLAALRTLARAHDPAARPAVAAPTVVAFRPPRRRLRRIAVPAAVAAGFVLALTVPWGRQVARKSVPPRAASPQPDAVAVRPVRPLALPRTPLEIELIRLSNAPARGPERAARAVLSRKGSSRRRPASREILALELANGSPRAAVSLPKAAVSPGASTPGPIRRPLPPHRSPAPSGPRA